MKNFFYITSLTLLLSTFNSSAFAETQKPAEDFKVQLKPDSAKTEKSAPTEKKVKEKTATSYKREINKEDGKTIYTVTGRAPHLYMISRDLYGSGKEWKSIASWNSLKAPYELRQGQQLVIKKEPTISNAESDEILKQAWGKMNRQDVVQGIEAAGEKEAPVAKAELPSPALAAPAVAATAAKPVEEAAAPAPAATPSPSPVEEKAEAKEEAAKEEKAEEKAPAKEEHPKEAHHSKWSVKTSLALSKFQVQGKANDGSSDITLDSDLDYGIELEVAYHLSETTELMLGASVEKMDIHPKAEVGEIEGESQYFAKYSLGVAHELTHLVTLAGFVNYEQTPFVAPEPTGAKVEGIFIPQLQLGARWNLIERGGFTTQLVTDAIISFPTNHDEFDLKSGGGWVAGFNFANKFSSKTLTYGVSYRDLWQDTDTSKNNLHTWFGNIGIIW